METKTTSSFKIILFGQLMVNLPVSVIIALVIIVSLNLGLGLTISMVIGSGVGWFVWGRFLTQWKNWVLAKGVDRERLFKLSKYGLINFYRYRIFDE
ncbi:MAG: hypothetical protein KBF42_09235 [Chitinophagales bacterium]|jgi:hypothetical protein|nr:hypothetical protein [Bacteroidota bacterium]MBK7567260.1 hypothetical protein [Bacteroidota bacterium]MBP8916804.1 hypothetical protein [Chitinophagales bacterium]MBP9221557.1 hypothetical protein [Chitinophagales bacterium]MBP9797469.1 hypothetical protein [Chitinophagales bacterium]